MKHYTRMSARLLAGLVVMLFAIEVAAAQNPDTLNGGRPDIVVTVKGMVCENCAYAVEKRVGRLEGVRGVEAHLDDQEVHITLAPDTKVNEEELREAVLDAGFEPVEVRYVVADGRREAGVE